LGHDCGLAPMPFKARESLLLARDHVKHGIIIWSRQRCDGSPGSRSDLMLGRLVSTEGQ
jgi:hypothetical protein